MHHSNKVEIIQSIQKRVTVGNRTFYQEQTIPSKTDKETDSAGVSKSAILSTPFG